jgi:protein-tyrosine-phosphatase
VLNGVDTMVPEQALRRVAQDLHAEFRGVFGEETIEALVFDSYRQMAATAKVTRWLVISTERFARQRLQASAHTAIQPQVRVPAVLFLCVHNAGRSQMALGWFSRLANGHAVAWSGGSRPGEQVNTAAIAAMAEIGIDISREFPKPWAAEFVDAADVVVTMGCGDTCPLVPGKHYEDWELDDPSNKTLAEIRPIRDEIGRRVKELLLRLEQSV